MKRILTRRRFGCLAIAGTAVAGLGYLTNKTLAETPALVLYGARPDSQAGVIVLQSLDVTTGVVQDLTTAALQLGEKLLGFTSLANGTLVLAIGPVITGKKENASTRLVFLGMAPINSLPVLKLEKQQALESLLGLNDGSLIGLVNKKNGGPPVDLVNIALNTGEISLIDKIKLPKTERFANLTQSPNGTIYTTVVGQEGETSLVQLDLGQGKYIIIKQLKLNGKIWDSGLSDLASSPASSANQRFLLGAPRYETPNKLYRVDISTGAMTWLRDFDVTKITAPRV